MTTLELKKLLMLVSNFHLLQAKDLLDRLLTNEESSDQSVYSEEDEAIFLQSRKDIRSVMEDLLTSFRANFNEDINDYLKRSEEND